MGIHFVEREERVIIASRFRNAFGRKEKAGEMDADFIESKALQRQGRYNRQNFVLDTTRMIISNAMSFYLK